MVEFGNGQYTTDITSTCYRSGIEKKITIKTIKQKFNREKKHSKTNTK